MLVYTKGCSKADKVLDLIKKDAKLKFLKLKYQKDHIL